MNQVITTEVTVIEQQGKETINARELHTNLGLKGDFSDWMRRWIKADNLVEGVDYLLLSGKEQLSSGAKYTKDYFVVTEVAKLKAASSNTPAGKHIVKQLIKRNTYNDKSELSELKQMILVIGSGLAALTAEVQTIKQPYAQNNLIAAPVRVEKKPMLTVYEYFFENYPDHVLAEIDEESIAYICRNNCQLHHVKLEAVKGTPVTEIKMPRERINYVMKNHVTFYGKRLNINY